MSKHDGEMRTEILYVNRGGLKPVFLTTYDEHGSIETATGFLVEAKNYIALVTNWHVVTGKRRNSSIYRYGSRQPTRMDAHYYVDMGDGGSIGSHTINIPLYKDEHNEIPNWFEHPKYGKLVDVVAIAMCTKPNDDTKPYYVNIGEEQEWKKWKERDVVSVVGFPHGLQIQMTGAIWTTGNIASNPNMFLNIDGEHIRAFLIDSRTRSGQSGSPVIAIIEKGDKALLTIDEQHTLRD